MRAFVVAALFGVLACSKQEPAPAPTPPSATASASAAATPSPAAAASSVAATPSASVSAGPTAPPPTEEDFEDEASRAVTAKTLDSQLDALEKEIQAD